MPAAVLDGLRDGVRLRVFCYTVALNLVPGDFRVHLEAKSEVSEPSEVSIVDLKAQKEPL